MRIKWLHLSDIHFNYKNFDSHELREDFIDRIKLLCQNEPFTHLFLTGDILFRNEQAGEMHGLTRVRQFTISEGHLVVAQDQLADEFKGCVELAKYCLTTLGLEGDVTYRLSRWDPEHAENYLGTAEDWDDVEDFMRDILNEIGIEFTEEIGEEQKTYTKTEINRMPASELKALAVEERIKDAEEKSGTELKKLLIE